MSFILKNEQINKKQKDYSYEKIIGNKIISF